MKAISLLEPWATLVALGHKRFETRSWRTHYRGPIAIHASMRKIPGLDGYRHGDHGDHFKRALTGVAFPRGRIVAVAELVECIRTVDIDMAEFGKGISDAERAFGNYEPGRWAWKLENVRRVIDGPFVKGTLGIWTVPDIAASAVGLMAEALPTVEQVAEECDRMAEAGELERVAGGRYKLPNPSAQ